MSKTLSTLRGLQMYKAKSQSLLSAVPHSPGESNCTEYDVISRWRIRTEEGI